MSRIAFECEAQNHHPNWSNIYNVLKISLSPHDADGVTNKDFKVIDPYSKGSWFNQGRYTFLMLDLNEFKNISSIQGGEFYIIVKDSYKNSNVKKIKIR